MWLLRERIRARAEHAEERSISVAVNGCPGEERAEDEERGRGPAADQPAECAEDGAENGEEEPRLSQIQQGRPARGSLLLFADVALGETARRPVRLGSVAAARAV